MEIVKEHETFKEYDNRMRSYEKSLDRKVGKDKILVVRMDGRGFSALTRENFAKPYDENFSNAMVKTTNRLVLQSGLDIIYAQTHSDEISIMISQTDNKFNGKERKLLSILASLTSVFFMKELGLILEPWRVSGIVGVFDCRIVPLPMEPDKIAEYFRWRALDSKRNALNDTLYWTLIANEGYSGKKVSSLMKSMSREDKKLMLMRYGIDFDSLSASRVYGHAFHFEDVEKEGYNPVLKETVKVMRRVLSAPYGVDIDKLDERIGSIVEHDMHKKDLRDI